MLPVVLSVSVWFGSYSVLDAGKKNTPELTERQQAWLTSIRCTPAYQKRWKSLRFTKEFIRGYIPTVPLAVFDPNGWTPANHCCGYFHIIGEGCRVYLDLTAYSIAAPPNEICLPGGGSNMSASPSPVIGQTWFIKHPDGAPNHPICSKHPHSA